MQALNFIHKYVVVLPRPSKTDLASHHMHALTGTLLDQVNLVDDGRTRVFAPCMASCHVEFDYCDQNPYIKRGSSPVYSTHTHTSGTR